MRSFIRLLHYSRSKYQKCITGFKLSSQPDIFLDWISGNLGDKREQMYSTAVVITHTTIYIDFIITILVL